MTAAMGSVEPRHSLSRAPAALYPGLLILAGLAGQTWLSAFGAGALCAITLAYWRRDMLSMWLPLGLIGFLALVNSMKWPDSDLGWYYTYVDYVNSTPLGEVLLTEDVFLSIRQQEMLFKLVVWLLGAISGGNRAFFTLATTILIYGSAMATCRMLLRTMAADQQRNANARSAATLTPLVISAALLIGITFSLTAHLTRQYLAGSLFVLGLFLWVTSTRKWGLLLAALAVTIHISAALLLLPLALALVYRRSATLYSLCFLAMVAALASGVLDQLFDLTSQASLLRQDGEQGGALLLIDTLILAGAAWLYYLMPVQSPAARKAFETLLAFAAAFATLLLLVHGAPFLFFRTYMYIEFLRTPLVAFILFAVLQRLGPQKFHVAILLLLLGTIVCWTRAMKSEWIYTSDGAGSAAFTMVGVFDRWTLIQNQ
jgi:hypothetical protein